MEPKNFKIILVGEAAVGKTSILYRYIFEEFNQELLATITISSENKEITINNEKIMLSLWDTCGQEKYKSLANVFFKNMDAAILVYDCTSRKSFEELNNYWLKTIKNEKEDIVLGVISNKIDLYNMEVVTREEGENFAKEIGAEFGYISAYTGLGVDDFFEKIANKIFEKNPLPKAPANIKIKNEEQKGGKYYRYCCGK